jgi:hypothetical protein
MGEDVSERAAPEGGLYLKGTVVGRTRKITDNGCRYMYTIDTGFGITKLSAWGDHDFLPVGMSIDAQVDIRVYVSRTGRPMYQLSLPANSIGNGEEAF